MTRAQQGSTRDLPGFRWRLQALERKQVMALEQASLALAVAQRETLALARRATDCRSLLQEQEGWARENAQRDPRLQAHGLGWLLAAHAQVVTAQRACAAHEQRLGVLRSECVERQRELDAVLALRGQAQRTHAQAALGRQAREADAAWLARAAATREGGA